MSTSNHDEVFGWALVYGQYGRGRPLPGFGPVRSSNADSNDLHVAGRTCRRCGTRIAGAEPVRRVLDGGYVHDVCPGDRAWAVSEQSFP